MVKRDDLSSRATEPEGEGERGRAIEGVAEGGTTRIGDSSDARERAQRCAPHHATRRPRVRSGRRSGWRCVRPAPPPHGKEEKSCSLGAWRPPQGDRSIDRSIARLDGEEDRGADRRHDDAVEPEEDGVRRALVRDRADEHDRLSMGEDMTCR